MVLIIAPAIDGLRKDWREASENMGASSCQYWRHVALPILMPSLLGTMILLFGNAFGAQATAYQLTRRADQHRHDPHLPPDPRRRRCTTRTRATPWRWAWSSIMAVTIVGLLAPPAARGALAAMTQAIRRRPTSRTRSRRVAHGDPSPRWRRRRAGGSARIVWWIVFLLGFLLLLPAPLRDARMFSLRAQPFLSAYTASSTTRSSSQTLGYSFVAGIITIIVSIAPHRADGVLGPARLPRLRPVVEFITLLPFVIPPIILVFGLISTYSQPPLPLTGLGPRQQRPARRRLRRCCRSRTCTGPSTPACGRSTSGASPRRRRASARAGSRILWRVILPNLRVSLLSGAFLTLAIVVGEFTIATFLARPAFAPYLSASSAATRPTSRPPSR